ncbi:MAG: hypothetical protein HZB56_14830 [Deltaproteobacteria bacterium]|nr:hypothetical protein [Deltaproteobacteria bacterium]
MLDLLAAVSAHLAARGVAHALVGAGALAVHGVSRSTFDVDLLAVDAAVLDPAFWSPLAARGARVDVRAGEGDDPLRGVVRLSQAGERPVDLIVGRAAWQAEALARAAVTPVGPAAIAVVTRADLVLLKLFAGGPQDAWDLQQLLAAGGRSDLLAEVEARLDLLPPEAEALWRKVRGAR